MRKHFVSLTLSLGFACANEPGASSISDASVGAPDAAVNGHGDAAAPFDPCSVAPESVACRGEGPPYTGSHPIDRLLHRRFWLDGHTPELASTEELCQRMAVDLLGVTLSRADLARVCAGSTAEALARAMQSRPEYLNVAQRHWRDRLDVDDVVADWRYTKDLFAIVDRLHRGEIGYARFVEEVVTHPGFMAADTSAEDRVRLAFRAFLGREATPLEAADLSALLRPFLAIQSADPDFPYLYRFEMYLYPFLCEPLFGCRSELLGGGTLELGILDAGPVSWEDLSPAQRVATQELGRMFARQSTVFEVEADAILDRLLGWSDGGRFPRRPGILLPEVRQLLAERLSETGDVAAAERLVLTSWLYTQTARADRDGPPYTSGPIKRRSAEAWLSSTEKLAISIGGCDPRYSDGFPYFQMLQAAQTGTITTAQLEADALRLHAMQESRVPLALDEDLGIQFPSFGYAQIARLIGGCPGFQARRSAPEGIAYSYSQESLAELVCRYYLVRGAPPGVAAPTPREALEHQMGELFGRSPAPDEIEAFESAFARCSGAECERAELLIATCSALLGSAEALFY